MDVFKIFARKVVEAVEAAGREGQLPDGMDAKGIVAEPPRDPSHGDIATNAAMVLARQAKMKPRDIAEILTARLAADASVEHCDIAGPGFINLKIAPSVWQNVVSEIIEAGADFGDADSGQSTPINVEYVSANPTGPLHVGHVRGAVYGDALANLLAKAGYDVCREYYINDAGAQIDVLAKSTYLRYREALGHDIGDIPEGLYPGDYLIAVGKQIASEDGERWLDVDEADWLATFRQKAANAMMALIREDLETLGIRQETFSSELALHRDGRVQQAVDWLADRDLVYTGVLEPPKGKKPDDWEPRPQLLFKATQFGDDVDRPLKKSDGTWTYFAADIAYHFDKFQRGYPNMIDVLGADHGGYVKRMKAAVKAITDSSGELDARICQLVNLMDQGQPVKMSKRAGSFVTLRDVVDEVGRDVVRFIMLTRKNEAPLDFDFAKVTEQSRDNPVFYVQYAHARTRSVIMRNAPPALPGVDLSDAALSGADLTLLNDENELSLIRNMASWPRIVESAADAHEPHRIAFYLYDLASDFHGLWNKGKEDPSLRFIVEGNEALSLARIAMVRALGLVIASGLAVLGVEPAEEMR